MTFRAFALCLFTAATLGLTACGTTDPYTGEERTARASTGAAIGAIAGAAIGIATGSDSRERRQRAAIGAGIGGLSGAAVGAYMDRQEDKLRQQLQGTGVSVTRQGDELTLNMPGNITFGFDSAELRSEFYDVLDSVVLVLEEFDQTLIEVAGHTDSIGDPGYNQRLSERRAESVGRYLRSEGITRQRIATAGFGEEHPIADNSTDAGRQANRRVELTLIPITEN